MIKDSISLALHFLYNITRVKLIGQVKVHLPQLIQFVFLYEFNSSFLKARFEDEFLAIGMFKSYIAVPIIGPPFIIFSGFDLKPPISSINS